MLLLASDFDGTLAPINLDPESVAIDPTLAEVLSRASAHPSVVVAVISGRDVDDLEKRLETIECWMSGSHGLEVIGPDRAKARRLPPETASLPEYLTQSFRAAELRLEPKRFGVALHWRDVPGITDDHPLVGEFESWARETGLEIVRGRAVSEARRPGGGKLEALQELAAITGATRVVFAGDDLTDFPALQWAAGRGRGLFLASDERQPPPGVEVVASRKELAEIFRAEVRKVEA
jgi:trehalose 6-phosphate phosphatase